MPVRMDYIRTGYIRETKFNLERELGFDGYPLGRKIYFVVGDRLVEGRRHAEPTTAKYRID